MGEAVESRRLLLVHAHPDDESIGTGATMAKYEAEGARVTLVTCTLGEIGEIIPPDLRHMLPDELGEYRIGELEEACAALGVADHRFLGGPGRWRDSGMLGMEENEDPRCFWLASIDEAAATLAEVIREVRPQAIVTYDANGFYGHPDHIQAHRVAWRARELAADPSASDAVLAGDPWLAARFYATAMPLSVAREAAKLPADSWFEQWGDFENCVPDDQVTTEIDASGYLDAKIAAMQAHTTQITVDGDFYALSNNRGHRILGTEYYIQLAGPPGDRNDLFSPCSLSPVPCWIMGTEPGGRSGSIAASAAIYVVLLVLGALQGLIGSFQYGQSPVPVIAILLAVIIFATCLFGAWGTASLGGALAPAIGWVVVSFILSIGTHGGSVIITNTTAGKWYLYGGTVAAALGAASGFVVWLRAKPAG